MTNKEAEHGRVSRIMTEYIERKLYLRMFAQRSEWEGGKCRRILDPKDTDVLRSMIKAACAAAEKGLLYDIYDLLQQINKL